MRGRRLSKIASTSVVVALVVVGCGTSDESSSGAKPTPPGMTAQKTLGDGEGAVNILAWPGYAEDGSTDKSVDWVTPFEQATGCDGHHQDRQHVRRDVHPNGHRTVRRRVGVGRLFAANDLRRKGRTRQHRPVHQLG